MVQRTEAQKKKDEKMGITKFETDYDKAKGMIVQTVYLTREFDPKDVIEKLPAYEDTIKQLELFIEDAEKKLKEIGDLEADEEVKKFFELRAKADKIEKKDGLVKTLADKKEDLAYEKDTFTEQRLFIAQHLAHKRANGGK